jgi:hypothetical protein
VDAEGIDRVCKLADSGLMLQRLQSCGAQPHEEPPAKHSPVVRFKSFLYQSASWKRTRRVVAKMEFHFGELFPRVGFIVTNLTAESLAVVRFYNKRGTAEQWIQRSPI